MKLTESELDQLKRVRQNRSGPPTVLGTMRKWWRAYLFLVAASSGAAVLFWWGGWPLASLFFAGYLVGFLVRDVKWLRTQKQFWRMSVEVTNWVRIDELIQENDRSAT